MNGAQRENQMRHDIVTVTPQMASEWLAHPAARQRSVSRNFVAQYARAMTEGRWQEPTIDPIALTPEGKLLNGQHRLLAVIKADRNVEMLIAFDVPEKIFDIIDTNRRRQAAQFVRTSSASLVASAARLILWYDLRRATGESPLHPLGFAIAFDNDEILGLIEGPLGETIQQSVLEANRAYRAASVPPSAHAAILTIARRDGADPNRLELWLEGVTDGLGLSAGDPRLLLRQRMQDHIRGKHTRGSGPAVWMLTARAFNAFMQGRTMRNLIYVSSDAPPAIDAQGTASASQPGRPRQYLQRPVGAQSTQP